MEKISIGIDLAGKKTNPTGICLLKGMHATTSILYKDNEIIDYVKAKAPDIVAIDAPLTKASFDDGKNGRLRGCEIELKKRNIHFFPISLPSMKELTKRGALLANQLRNFNFKVIEVYPGGAQDIFGIPRKKYGKKKLLEGLALLGICGLNSEMSGHELDAVTAAFVGFLYLQNKAEIYGNFDGKIVMPKSNRKRI